MDYPRCGRNSHGSRYRVHRSSRVFSCKPRVIDRSVLLQNSVLSSFIAKERGTNRKEDRFDWIPFYRWMDRRTIRQIRGKGERQNSQPVYDLAFKSVQFTLETLAVDTVAFNNSAVVPRQWPAKEARAIVQGTNSIRSYFPPRDSKRNHASTMNAFCSKMITTPIEIPMVSLFLSFAIHSSIVSSNLRQVDDLILLFAKLHFVRKYILEINILAN